MIPRLELLVPTMPPKNKCRIPFVICVNSADIFLKLYFYVFMFYVYMCLIKVLMHKLLNCYDDFIIYIVMLYKLKVVLVVMKCTAGAGDLAARALVAESLALAVYFKFLIMYNAIFYCIYYFKYRLTCNSERTVALLLQCSVEFCIIELKHVNLLKYGMVKLYTDFIYYYACVCEYNVRSS